MANLNVESLIETVSLPIVYNAYHVLFKKKRKVSFVELYCLLQKEERRKRRRIDDYLSVVDSYLCDDFKSHFRMKRETMAVLIDSLGNVSSKMRNKIVKRGRPQQSLKLQCLVAVWTLANQESYRYLANIQ